MYAWPPRPSCTPATSARMSPPMISSSPVRTTWKRSATPSVQTPWDTWKSKIYLPWSETSLSAVPASTATIPWTFSNCGNGSPFSDYTYHIFLLLLAGKTASVDREPFFWWDNYSFLPIGIIAYVNLKINIPDFNCSFLYFNYFLTLLSIFGIDTSYLNNLDI